jgi:FkbM family methyltransferase
MGRIANTISKLKSKVGNRIFEALYRRMGRFYIEDYPELAGSAFSRIYPTLLCHNIELISYDQQEDQIYLQKGPILFSTSPNYPWIVREIFAQHIYFIHPKYLKAASYLVLDFGMNRGYAALYFAAQSWCNAVHGFELNELTFDLAKKNVDLNPALNEKIQLHNFGLGKQDERLKCYYLPDRDGICTTSADFLQSYAPEELERVLEKEITIKKTSTFLQSLLSALNSDTRIMLKIDVEGAEYDILTDLVQDYPAFFGQVDIIIGEAHLGLEPISDMLAPFGYTNVCKKNYNPKTRDFLFVRP